MRREGQPFYRTGSMFHSPGLLQFILHQFLQKTLKSLPKFPKGFQQELEKDLVQYLPLQRFMDAKMVSPDPRSTSYYILKGVPKADVAERAALQPNMMQGIAPFNGIAAVGGSYNKVYQLHCMVGYLKIIMWKSIW